MHFHAALYRHFRSLSGLLTFLFWLSSCKENTILPSDLVPAVDNISTFGADTFSLRTCNLMQDSLLTGGLRGTVRVSNSPTLFHALGTIANDPVFGRTHASFHVEVLPPVPNFAFKTQASGTTRIIDSIVLSVPYKGSYGDTLNNTQQTFKVYRSLKSFSRDSAQYDFTRDSVDHSRVLSSRVVNFRTLATDSPLVGTVKLQPQIRFNMASWFADSLQAQVDSGLNGAAADFSKFLNWWRGFAVEADSNQGATLGYFDTYNTRMYIYYRYTDVNNQPDTAVDVFAFDPNYCNRFNTIIRQYQGSVAQWATGNTTLAGDSMLFVQTEPGLVAEIAFPYLAEMENVVVNKAELTFTAVSPIFNWVDTFLYAPPPRMQVLVSDSSGSDAVLSEYATFGAGFVDGKRFVYTENGLSYLQYKFILTQTIQRAISQKNTNFRLKILGTASGYSAAYRTLLRGSGSMAGRGKPRLSLIYTKINK